MFPINVVSVKIQNTNNMGKDIVNKPAGTLIFIVLLEGTNDFRKQLPEDARVKYSFFMSII